MFHVAAWLSVDWDEVFMACKICPFAYSDRKHSYLFFFNMMFRRVNVSDS